MRLTTRQPTNLRQTRPASRHPLAALGTIGHSLALLGRIFPTKNFFQSASSAVKNPSQDFATFRHTSQDFATLRNFQGKAPQPLKACSFLHNKIRCNHFDLSKHSILVRFLCLFAATHSVLIRVHLWFAKNPFHRRAPACNVFHANSHALITNFNV